MAWVTTQVVTHSLGELSTLEVGSLNVNGSVRSLFTGPYIGVDYRKGSGVDRVMNGHDLGFPDASFDVVISTEMLEHDDAFWLSMAEMGRVTKRGGHLIVTARGNGFAEHSHPDDFWRFMPSSHRLLARMAGCDVVCFQVDPEPGILLHMVKP